MNEAPRSPMRPAEGSGGDAFTATHWTQITLAARDDETPEAREALETLCLRYWPAIYGFLRRRRHDPAEAEDLTQGFFVHLLDGKTLARADRTRGRFRSFLLGALRRFLADEQRRNGALKRGRGKVVEGMDFDGEEAGYLEEADPALTPDEVYDRRWAATVLEAAFAELEREFLESGQAERFGILKRFLAEEAADGDYAAEADRLGVAPRTVSSLVARFRERYRELVRRHVLTTVDGPDEIDAEFRELFR